MNRRALLDEENKLLRALMKNETGNAKALLRHIVKLEKKAGTFRREDWKDWCEQYKVKF